MKINWESKLYSISSQTKIYQHKLTLAPLDVKQLTVAKLNTSNLLGPIYTCCIFAMYQMCRNIRPSHIRCSPSEIPKKKSPKSLMSYLRFDVLYWVSSKWVLDGMEPYICNLSPCLAWFPRIFSCLTSFLRLGAPLPLPFFCFFPPEASV